MKHRLAVLSILAVLVLALVACSARGAADQQTGASGNKMATSLAAVKKALPNETPSAAAVGAGAAAATATTPPDDPVKDISTAKLMRSDFPDGYKELTSSDMKEMKLEPETLSGSITKNLKKAKVVNASAFMKEDVQNFELHVGMVIYPLTFLEKTSFDLEMMSPDKMSEDVAGQIGSDVSALPGASGIGDKSIGLAFKAKPNTSSKVQFLGQLVMARQNNAVVMVISMYLDGKQPGVSPVDLARKLNDRLASVVK